VVAGGGRGPNIMIYATSRSLVTFTFRGVLICIWPLLGTLGASAQTVDKTPTSILAAAGSTPAATMPPLAGCANTFAFTQGMVWTATYLGSGHRWTVYEVPHPEYPDSGTFRDVEGNSFTYQIDCDGVSLEGEPGGFHVSGKLSRDHLTATLSCLDADPDCVRSFGQTITVTIPALTTATAPAAAVAQGAPSPQSTALSAPTGLTGNTSAVPDGKGVAPVVTTSLACQKAAADLVAARHKRVLAMEAKATAVADLAAAEEFATMHPNNEGAQLAQLLKIASDAQGAARLANHLALKAENAALKEWQAGHCG
jgi:hypothetical protein